MESLIIVAALALLVGLSALWWWHLMIRPILRFGQEPSSLLLGPQLHLLLLTLSVVLKPSSFFWAVFTPWGVLPLILEDAAKIQDFLFAPLIAGCVAIALAITLFAVLQPKRRLFAPMAVALFGLLTMLAVAEINSRAAMQAVVTDLNGSCLARLSFLDSSWIAGAEIQFDLHAVTRADGKWHAWSYSEMNFYELPTYLASGDTLTRRCLAQIDTD